MYSVSIRRLRDVFALSALGRFDGLGGAIHQTRDPQAHSVR
jgi:hypothetical protein